MRPVFLLPLVLIATPQGVAAQVTFGLAYGVERNIDSGAAETDGWLTVVLEWPVSSRIALGIGTDHQFEGSTPSLSEHESWAIYLSARVEQPLGSATGFVRGGLGAGRAPCVGDTCTDGLHLRASAGLGVPVARRLALTGEIGVSRVSRPFAGVGLAVRM